MRIWQFWLALLALAIQCGSGIAAEPAATPAAAKPAPPGHSTADHRKFEALKGPFKSGSEVTKACLSCHTEAAGQIMRDKHWTWEHLNPETGQKLGKNNVINNFCVAAPSNHATCTSCHIGYGWKDNSFDFANKENVDCLVCHEKTGGKYRKLLGSSGYPVLEDTEFPKGSGKIIKGADLAEVAQTVGKSGRGNCGICHFLGGGGDGVKHGDIDTSLRAPDKSLDVHMDAKGLNFSCATCHMTRGHAIPGSRYATTAKDTGGAHMRGKKDDSNPTTCVACHGNLPHKKDEFAKKINQHTDKVACQTCHIPRFARGGVPTKMSWDWSTAGKLSPEGKPFVKKNDKGEIIYDSKKGDFVWARDVPPEYHWFNGRNDYTLVDAKIEKTDQPLQINRIGGSADDGKSLIWPFKVARGSQPYDPVNKTLVVPHVAGKDDTSYWENFDWQKAITTGMQSVDKPFSGKIDFIKTESYWPTTHMVAPAKDALDCQECHRKGGRLDKIEGIYIPGRDAFAIVDLIGWIAAAGTLGGVAVHGSLLAIRRRKHQGE